VDLPERGPERRVRDDEAAERARAGEAVVPERQRLERRAALRQRGAEARDRGAVEAVDVERELAQTATAPERREVAPQALDGEVQGRGVCRVAARGRRQRVEVERAVGTYDA
jgi:hypothetical protein